MSGARNEMNCTTKEMSELKERWLMIDDCIKGTWLEALRKVELLAWINTATDTKIVKACLRANLRSCVKLRNFKDVLGENWK